MVVASAAYDERGSQLSQLAETKEVEDLQRVDPCNAGVDDQHVMMLRVSVDSRQQLEQR